MPLESKKRARKAPYIIGYESRGEGQVHAKEDIFSAVVLAHAKYIVMGN